MPKPWLPALALLVAFSSLAQNATYRPTLDLQLRELTLPLQNLSSSDHQVVDEAIAALRRSEHAVALANLTRLTASNPSNSSLRVLRAFALLELGNVTGALADSKLAEGTGEHAAWRCWFLAQVAMAAGNKPLCRREIKHLAGNPQYGEQAQQLLQRIDAPKR
jgi:predicted Zn-dependent protease